MECEGSAENTGIKQSGGIVGNMPAASDGRREPFCHMSSDLHVCTVTHTQTHTLAPAYGHTQTHILNEF